MGNMYYQTLFAFQNEDVLCLVTINLCSRARDVLPDGLILVGGTAENIGVAWLLTKHSVRESAEIRCDHHEEAGTYSILVLNLLIQTCCH